MADRVSLRDLVRRDRSLASGHRACAGCTFPSIIRIVLGATDYPVVVANATGCMEVVSSIYPYNAWRVPWIHNAFENAASTIAGVEAAYKALRRKGKIDKEIKFIAFGGDGGTYDIGFQALSGAIERGHDFLYVCYDNGAYMNTGIQRSGGTPHYAATTTSPAGRAVPGKPQRRKPLTEIVAAHNNVYAAQASPSHWGDLAKKAKKAIEYPGPAFLNVLMPCPPGWGFPDDQGIAIARLAVETGFWPLFEVEPGGYYTINYRPKEFKPIEEFLKTQRRFRHILDKPELIEEIKREIAETWERLEFLASRPKPK